MAKQKAHDVKAKHEPKSPPRKEVKKKTNKKTKRKTKESSKAKDAPTIDLMDLTPLSPLPTPMPPVSLLSPRTKAKMKIKHVSQRMSKKEKNRSTAEQETLDALSTSSSLEHTVETILALDEKHLLVDTTTTSNAEAATNSTTPSSAQRWGSLSNLYISSDDDVSLPSDEDEASCPVCLGILQPDQERQLVVIQQLLCKKHALKGIKEDEGAKTLPPHPGRRGSHAKRKSRMKAKKTKRR